MKLNIYTEIYTLKNAHLDDFQKNKYVYIFCNFIYFFLQTYMFIVKKKLNSL